MYDKHLNSGILCMAVELEMGFKGSIFLAFFFTKKTKNLKSPNFRVFIFLLAEHLNIQILHTQLQHKFVAFQSN